MKAILALTRLQVRLSFREKAALFFNFAFPLLLFFLFAQMTSVTGPAMAQVIAMNLVIAVIAGGLFGAGLRTVQDRETNVLRRYKVAPITPLPLLLASQATGLLLFLPVVALMIGIAHVGYAMPLPPHLVSLLVFACLGAVAFRALGLLVAAVASNMGEAQVVTQILFFPLMFLSGAMMPLSSMPAWLRNVVPFIPTSHLSSGLLGMLVRRESLADNALAVFALLTTAAIGTLLAARLFRWEKDQPVPRGALGWVAAVLVPFLLVGAWQARTQETVTRSRMVEREVRRARVRLVRNVRLFTGDGSVRENVSVLVRNGRVETIYDGSGPEPSSVRAEAVEGAGKTLLPGFIDLHVHLGTPGGLYEKQEDYQKPDLVRRALAAYLFSGVVAVRSAGDLTKDILSLKQRVNSGEVLTAELFPVGPLFTAEGGHGTEYFRGLPEPIRRSLEAEFLRLPKTAAEARQQVRDLKGRGVDVIKLVLETGAGGTVFTPIDQIVARAVAEEARAQRLPLMVHTGGAADVADAVALGATSIEHGSARDRIPEATLAAMAQQGITLVPTLSVVEGFEAMRQNSFAPLDRTLVQQVALPGLLASTRRGFRAPAFQKQTAALRDYPADLSVALDNVRRAHAAGVAVATGTDSGNLLLVHGPAVHRELQLLVQAGLTPAQSLLAATARAARVLGASSRLGLVTPGREASLLLVDGNPLQEIAATERVSGVFLKGELVSRGGLLAPLDD